MNTTQEAIQILNVIENRRSPRAFDPERAVGQESLERLFEAARWAASSYNEQPWRFLVGVKREGEGWNKIFDSLGEFNQAWAKHAPVLILACVKKQFSQNGAENKHARYDLGQAMAHFALQATEEGLFLHQMAGFSADKARETFRIPEGFEPVTAVALGYLGKKEQLPEKLQAAEGAARKRKPQEEWVFFQDQWPDQE